MVWLVITSLLWAFSFTLVKQQLSGLDPVALSVLRLALATLVFLPWLRLQSIPTATRLRLAAIGAVQFGLMYVFYLAAFRHLKAYEVALFTVFTPLYVVGIDACLERRWSWRFLAAALLAVCGTAIVALKPGNLVIEWRGLLLVQGSNLCFALGQLLWRRERSRIPSSNTDASLFALPYAGALSATLVCSLFTTQWSTLSLNGTQWLTLAYLGIIASGLCFFLWNLGATRVNAGLLAAMNNAKMPLAVAVALLVGGEQCDVPRLLLGGGLVLAAAILCARAKG